MKVQCIIMSFRVSVWSLCLCSLLALSGIVRGDEPEPAPLRMWHVGNSWSIPFPFEKVGFTRPFSLHTHNFGGGGKNWVEEALEKDKKEALVKGEFDVVYLGFVQLAQPVEALDQMADVALKHKPDCRIYLQHAWASGGGNWAPANKKRTWPREDDDLTAIQAEWDKRRKKLEDKVDEINKRHGKQVMFIVPLADAVMEMRKLVVAGKLPGVTKQSQLFWDNDDNTSLDDHAGNQTVVLAMYCAHAAIYRKSPEGLKVSSPDGFYWGPKGGKVPMDDAQHAILQKLAWETVSKYPHAGITKAK